MSSCARCGSDFFKKYTRHKFCAPCGPLAESERSRERMREQRRERPREMKQYQSEWNSQNRERIRATAKARRARLGAVSIGSKVACAECAAPFAIRGTAHKRCDACSAKIRSQLATGRAAEWNKLNSDKRNARARKRLATDATFRLNVRMSRGIGAALKGNSKAGKSWQELVPYTLDELRDHIERQFHDGMNWHNMGQWHIDHIVPLSAFKFTEAADPQFRAAWALTNLRPLWALENVRKSAARIFLI